MSREQLTEQQAQQDNGGFEPNAQGDVHGLPPHLYELVLMLGPGDAQGLKNLLDIHEELSQQILSVASSHVPLSTIRRAIAMAQQNRVGAAGSSSQQDMHEMLDDAPKQSSAAAPSAADSQQYKDDLDSSDAVAMRPEIRNEVLAIKPGDARALAELLGQYTPVEGQIRALASRHLGNDIVREALHLRQQMEQPQGPAPALPSRDEMAAQLESGSTPAWVPDAHKYNKAHAALVAEFNEATSESCVDAAGELDPQAVAAWQAAHGVEADGKVGHHTVVAARKAKTKGAEVAQAAQPEARPPV